MSGWEEMSVPSNAQTPMQVHTNYEESDTHEIIKGN
jgi:hypothetical protein